MAYRNSHLVSTSPESGQRQHAETGRNNSHWSVIYFRSLDNVILPLGLQQLTFGFNFANIWTTSACRAACSSSHLLRRRPKLRECDIAGCPQSITFGWTSMKRRQRDIAEVKCRVSHLAISSLDIAILPSSTRRVADIERFAQDKSRPWDLLLWTGEGGIPGRLNRFIA